MTTQIDLRNPRTVKAIEVLAGVGQWLKVRARDGRKAYGIPSQRVAGLYYFTTYRSCTCADFRRHSRYQWVCKHMLALRIHLRTIRPVEAGGEVDVLGLANNLLAA